MGSAYTFSCKKCGYTADSCGKLDWGFHAVLEPYVCSDCKELTDVLVGEYGKKLPHLDISESFRKESYVCSECNSQNIVLWDLKKKPCPKCGSRMHKNKEGIITLWD